MCLFSIITVCYNAENEINRTIESVLSQTYTNYEYLIIDGKSRDTTVQIAESYKSSFDKINIHYTIVSEKDSGIYDAMNKGIRLSKGKWVQFLNAGDYLCKEDVLEKVEPYCDESKSDVVYGDVIYEKNFYETKFYRYQKCYELAELAELAEFRMPFCHQSTFTSTKILHNHGFSKAYKVCADHDLYLKLYNLDARFKYIPIPVSIFSIGGISTTNILRLRKEVLQINKDQGIIDSSTFEKMTRKVICSYRIKNVIKKLIYYPVKELLPAIEKKVMLGKMRRQGWSNSLKNVMEENQCRL